VISRLRLNAILAWQRGTLKFQQDWTPRSTWKKFDEGQDFVSCQIQHEGKAYFIVARWLIPFPRYNEIDPVNTRKGELILSISRELPQTLELSSLDVELIHGFGGLPQAIKALQNRENKRAE
jgi:hypothetical protein